MDSLETTQPGAMPGISDPAPSVWSRIGNVFFSPAKAFENFKITSGGVGILIGITIVLSIAISFPIANIKIAEQFQAMQQSGNEVPEAAKKLSYLIAVIVAPMFVVFLGLICSLLAWMIGGFILGGRRVSFVTVWAVNLLGGLITMLGGILKVPLIIAKGSADVSFGLTALLGSISEKSILYMLASNVDVFAIWAMVCLGFGYAAIFGFTKGKGIGISAAIWILMVLGGLGLAIVGLMISKTPITFS